ncbi:unnamed protein product [Rotaria magnacalcarata]
MSTLNQSIEPYYMQFLRCAKYSHVFEYENRSYHPITLPTCDHTMCKQYIGKIRDERKCPQDQVSFGIDHRPIDQLPTNYPLLIILYDPSKLPKDHKERYGQCPSYMKLDDETKTCFISADKTLGDISMAIKPIINTKECESVISRSMIRKIFSLLNSQYVEREGRSKFLKAMRSLAEHICIDIMLGHQNPQQLTNDVWSAVGFQNHTFYESAMQEKVLNHILSFFKHHAESRAEDIVSFVIKDVHANDRRDIRHIVDLLSCASCFQIKQERNSSLMQLKQDFKNCEDLRAAYDSKIIQIALKEGFYTSPAQWSFPGRRKQSVNGRIRYKYSPFYVPYFRRITGAVIRPYVL